MPVRNRRVVVVGAPAVGKSSVTIQFVENHFVDSYYPTIENQFSKTIRYRGSEYAIEIMDTAGQDEYSMVNQKHVMGVHGYILLYSVTSRASLEMVPIIRDKILNSLGADYVPAVMVGNKSDLQMQRQVSEEEGRALARQLRCGFVEASARHNQNVVRAFELLIGEIDRAERAATAEPEASQWCTLS